ncbi:MAG TPA: DUF4292 domain-containing protein [Lacibacter sp.]|nr:DUF4292 domain-containing protein [Lacibacter sp.]HMO88804.1 DUF4292 domain-containing protein [Lacibacter sp.]HMP88243.1 DUF4292 domain-containing protein [Lacibacter sp.]
MKPLHIFIVLTGIALLAACRSTKNIQQAIVKKDTVEVIKVYNPTHADTLNMVYQLLDSVARKQISYQTFSAKIKVSYSNQKGKQPDFTANIRMQKDSLIWISLSNDIGIEGLRIVINADSIMVLDKLANTYQQRPLSSIQEVSQIPFALSDLQRLLVGLPLFFNKDSILAYANKQPGGYTLLSSGDLFRHLLSINPDFTLERSKLDDTDPVLNRTADLFYRDYEEKTGVVFSTYREIFISQQNKLNVQLKFKDYRFNEALTFPFSIPKRYKRID